MREKWINFLCMLSIATGLFLMGFALLFIYNIDLATKKLPERFSVSVFLEDGISSSSARDIMKKAKNHSAVKRVDYISKEDALNELKTVMKDADYILEGLDSNPLPSSIEIRLRKGSLSGASVTSLVKEMEKIEGVDDVQYGRKLLSIIQSVRKHSEGMGIVIVGALCAGVIFVCYSTVKILLYRKNDEIETLKLLGATKGFIKSPFVFEGSLLGLAGGVVSAVAMAGLYYFINFKLTAHFPLLEALSTPIELLQYAPLAGLIIGLAGAYIAVGKIKF
jgi:cell division transport system permease protein